MRKLRTFRLKRTTGGDGVTPLHVVEISFTTRKPLKVGRMITTNGHRWLVAEEL